MKYRVTLTVGKRAIIDVNAKDIQEAIDMAKNKFAKSSIGDIICEDAKPVITPVTPKMKKRRYD